MNDVRLVNEASSRIGELRNIVKFHDDFQIAVKFLVNFIKFKIVAVGLKCLVKKSISINIQE